MAGHVRRGQREGLVSSRSERAREGRQSSPSTATAQLRAVWLQSWVTAILLPTTPPVAIAINYYHGPSGPILTFVLNFIALIPLGRVLEFVTEELIIRHGAHTGLNLIATFSNALQLIQTIIAVIRRQPAIVQTSLVGAVISNTVLVTGVGFLRGGWGRNGQKFNPDAVAWPINILVLSFAAIMTPTAMTTSGSNNNEAIVKTSRALSVILILCYSCYLFFALKSHYETFAEPPQRIGEIDVQTGDARKSLAVMGNAIAATGGARGNPILEPIVEGSPSLSVQILIFTLSADIALLGICTDFMVDSIDGLTQKTQLSQSFVGVILLPLLGCNLLAIKLAKQDRLQQSFELTANNSVQVLLFILPLAVMIGWIRDDSSMTLLFDGPQVISLGVSIWTLKTLTERADGESRWLDGIALLALFLVIALNAWFAPEKVLRP